MTLCHLLRANRAFEQHYIDSLPHTTQLVILDIDAFDDPTHGEQQCRRYHGFYKQYMLFPMAVFDGITGNLISVMLRSGTAHASKGAKTCLDQLIRAIKMRCPDAWIVVRGGRGNGWVHSLPGNKTKKARLVARFG